MADRSKYLILVASSGRMLAEAARKAGLKPLVIDLFADLDTQGLAEDYRQVQSLALEQLSPAIDYFVQRYATIDVIYGSGLEYYPECVSYLDSRLNILGNDFATFKRLLDKQDFFNQLERLDIHYPEVCFVKPCQDNDWLIKPLNGQGGRGITRFHHQDVDSAGGYWQKYQTGKVQSVLFLANGERPLIIGFNSQWTAKVDHEDGFIFSGVINHTQLTNAQKQQIQTWLSRLVPLYHLKGLNSLDFIQDGEKSFILEINPRPSASMAVYEDDLISAHIQACQGFLADKWPMQTGYSGYQIVYARQELLIPDDFEWHEGCRDLPVTQAIIGARQPICSIIAHQNEALAVLRQLSNLEHTLINKLERFQTHAIHR